MVCCLPATFHPVILAFISDLLLDQSLLWRWQNGGLKNIICCFSYISWDLSLKKNSLPLPLVLLLFLHVSPSAYDGYVVHLSSVLLFLFTYLILGFDFVFPFLFNLFFKYVKCIHDSKVTAVQKIYWDLTPVPFLSIPTHPLICDHCDINLFVLCLFS